MKKTKINIIIAVFIAMILLNTNIYAAIMSLNAGISSNKSIVTQGEQVIITINLKDFAGTGDGINAFKGTFTYDKNIFEEIELEQGGNTSLSIDSLNRWDVPTYNATTGELITTKGTFLTTTEDIIQITLTVKANAKEGNTIVSLSNVEVGNDTDEKQLTNVSTTIQIKSESDNSGGGDNSGGNNSGGNNSGGNNSGTGNTDDDTPKTPSTPQDSTTKNEQLPQTGTTNIIVIAIAIIAINAIVAFVKYKKVK